jgi:hypothetical protein
VKSHYGRRDATPGRNIDVTLKWCGGEFQLSISATSHGLDDTLADSGDYLTSLTDLLSPAWPVASRVAYQVMDLTVDSSHNELVIQVTQHCWTLTVIACKRNAYPHSLSKLRPVKSEH